MAGSVNKVILIGNLGRDPEVRHTNDGLPIVNMSLATSESWRDRTSGEPSPYVLVRDRLEALIARPVYYQLVDLGVEENIGGHHCYGVWSMRDFFSLGPLEDRA